MFHQLDLDYIYFSNHAHWSCCVDWYYCILKLYLTVLRKLFTVTFDVRYLVAHIQPVVIVLFINILFTCNYTNADHKSMLIVVFCMLLLMDFVLYWLCGHGFISVMSLGQFYDVYMSFGMLVTENDI